ncbi:hypothetical protein BKI52_11435 [marine bacterium AO1-C]|nr:hypothetical protein BKI52_11435 [marine bacterium AO1-C]
MKPHSLTYLQQFKSHFNPSGYQFVLLDNQGIIVESCNTLFNLTFYQGLSAFTFIPFLESIEETLIKLSVADQPLYFPRLDIPFFSHHHIYDFTFQRFQPTDDDSFIAWVIKDNTNHYHYLRQIQQERNLAIVKNERSRLNG